MLNRLKHDTLSKNRKVCVSQERCARLSLQYLKSSAKIVVTLRVGETEKLREEGKKGREGTIATEQKVHQEQRSTGSRASGRERRETERVASQTVV